MKEIKSINPINLGWLQSQLDKKEMDYLWQLVEERGKQMKSRLAGNINSTYSIFDKDNWFLINVLSQLGMEYENRFANLGKKIPTTCKHSYCLSNMWVNYQKQYEFNPIHDHQGIYSFVIWMKIPTEFKDQIEFSIAENSNTNVISNFCFIYQNIIGDMQQFVYEMSKEVEGTILFFPSQLGHIVYPFYGCEEDRISISGNIKLNTNQINYNEKHYKIETSNQIK